MAEIKVQDLIRSIREHAQESAQHAEPSLPAGAAKPMARLQTSLTITERTHDQLPPVTTYRRGLSAGLELWIKRLLKRATHWFTWEQVNFNSSVNSALNNTLAILQTYEQQLASLQNELDASAASKAVLEKRLMELESSLGRVESKFEELLAEKTTEIRVENQKSTELLLNEQRVSFKQLALEISEAGVIADRTKRGVQLRLEELSNRLDSMSGDQREVSPEKREHAGNRDLL